MKKLFIVFLIMLAPTMCFANDNNMVYAFTGEDGLLYLCNADECYVDEEEMEFIFVASSLDANSMLITKIYVDREQNLYKVLDCKIIINNRAVVKDKTTDMLPVKRSLTVQKIINFILKRRGFL